MPFVSYKIILGFIELVTGALTKGCTCMHIIILILSEIDIYFAYIYIYKFHSYPPLCSALFIWVNYTWPLKKKKKKKLAKFTKLLKPQNWKKKIKKKINSMLVLYWGHDWELWGTTFEGCFRISSTPKGMPINLRNFGSTYINVTNMKGNEL